MAQQRRLAAAGRVGDQQAIAALQRHLGAGQQRLAVGQVQAEVAQRQRMGGLFPQLNAARLMMHLIDGGVEAGQTVDAGFPGRQIVKCVDKPRQRTLYLAEGRGDLHQAAHLNGAGEVARRRHQQGKYNGELAVEVGGDVQPPGDAHNRPPVAANGVETVAQLLRLARFAVVQRNGVVVFADADQAETEVCLIPFLVEAQHDQRFADPPDQQRSQHRIQ